MGQAWCKEKSTKAQDSKSPLDRVFLRCAHRIYPGLKEEGSVLGGATQRVTSSEIGYASSPPREALARGQSIDSVDRPFQPSDWVDVNLEVPGTPRGSSAMTNLTLDSTLYPSTTLASTNSSGTNLRDFTPVPPPRRRKKNRGRPLPPKPDQVAGRAKESRNSSYEPLYSSVKPRDPTRSNKIEIYEHKVNGTGRVIPSTVVAGNRSNREKSSQREDDGSGNKNSRAKNGSTVSLPNYSELDVSQEVVQNEVPEELEIRKITAAGSLPALITSGALENIIKSEKKIEETNKTEDDTFLANRRSVDEVDFSFDPAKNLETLNNIYKLESPRGTSTPVKSDFDHDVRTPSTGGGWFLHPEKDSQSVELEDSPKPSQRKKHETEKSQVSDCAKSSQSEIFYEAEEDQQEESRDNRPTSERGAELGSEDSRKITSLRRTLSNESEPFDSYEAKELRETSSTRLRSNSPMKLAGRSISEESLPVEMVDRVETDSLEDKRSTASSNYHDRVKKTGAPEQPEKSNDTKTPPPSPEPKIKPEILDNDHSTLLKVLRDEAEESNLSSMTPSLTELEAALSDMLEKEDDNESPGQAHETPEKIVTSENAPVAKALEEPIEPKIVQIDLDKSEKHSGVSVSLKNILGESDDASSRVKSMEKFEEISKMIDVDLTNGDDRLVHQETRNTLAEIAVDNTWSTAIPTMEPPEKPSRLHQVSLGESSQVLEKGPTPPRRRNRSSLGLNKENLRRSIERTATPENPYPNDRLI